MPLEASWGPPGPSCERHGASLNRCEPDKCILGYFLDKFGCPFFPNLDATINEISTAFL